MKKSYFKQKSENKEKKFNFFPVVDSNLNQTWTFGDRIILLLFSKLFAKQKEQG